ncbi:hypothetical protein GLOTRDRAFT_82067 [Gloeophyllum trabeum ATCC 11539]|uniref:Rab-GAP TBC domain-containing protein n=1 Tax=Gloeophyllum trabeum (strain ATCC 11539 / FP-39264 / Madison 617) TaxID=670483 RepID=S7PU08_GLOTA|nr:uncharacterized protein GLOTRDRAFT_82067 [Gloeophyllum trabeum ATCC 11539]EPQ50933.1 hypothetical protein GLOTRDRAFT_82067 [Gloeophyllum trabeum ATCC 11539]
MDAVPAESEKLEGIDWQALRDVSAKPGGLGKERETLWPRLLHVNPNVISHTKPEGVEPPESHRDERQIKLDTERSFVLYPVGDPGLDNRETLQGELHELLVSIFRKRRKLNYFQGYHDIITVLFLTLPKEVQFVSAEKFSLHRLRDSMGSSLEPVLGQLRILQKLMRLADPQYAAVLDANAPLPYYALSNLLTLFAHDVPTLLLIQHIFDYLLTRPPIASVYLAAAILLSRKEEVLWLEQEGEEGMMHSLLSSLPEIYEEGDGEAPEPCEELNIKEEEGESLLEETRSITASEVEDTAKAQSEKGAESWEREPESPPERPSHTYEEPSEADETLQAISETSEADFSREETLVASSPAPGDSKEIDPSLPKGDSGVEVSTCSAPPGDREETLVQLSEEENLNEKEVPESRPSSPASSVQRVRRARVSLTSLLNRADDLFSLYPPTHPDLAVSKTMGPQSVIFTWSENPSDLPDDDEAEAMVLHPELVVLPVVESDAEDEEEEEGHEKKERRRRRKLKKPRRFGGVVVERRVMVAGAVLVLGVAMAVYGIRAAPEEPMSRHHWKKLGRWVGGVLVGASGRILDGIRL